MRTRQSSSLLTAQLQPVHGQRAESAIQADPHDHGPRLPRHVNRLADPAPSHSAQPGADHQRAGPEGDEAEGGGPLNGELSAGKGGCSCDTASGAPSSGILAGMMGGLALVGFRRRRWS